MFYIPKNRTTTFISRSTGDILSCWTASFLDRNHFCPPRLVAEPHKRDERCRPSFQSLKRRLGHSLSSKFYKGSVVRPGKKATHKRSRVESGLELKDLTWSDNDNNMYLGPVVVAQQVLDPSPQTSYPWKEKKEGGGHIRYNQVFRSLIPGSRYRFTSQDVTGKVIFYF